MPSRRYRLDVRSYPITLDDLKKTMKFLRERQEQYYLVYRLILEECSASPILFYSLRTTGPARW
ncbi:MAG: hypothetical protein GU361_00265 [Desulfurococcales archaeon]|nr:hypothetical protein [Desulfurococcales archaeon]